MSKKPHQELLLDISKNIVRINKSDIISNFSKIAEIPIPTFDLWIDLFNQLITTQSNIIEKTKNAFKILDLDNLHALKKLTLNIDEIVIPFQTAINSSYTKESDNSKKINNTRKVENAVVKERVLKKEDTLKKLPTYQKLCIISDYIDKLITLITFILTFFTNVVSDTKDETNNIQNNITVNITQSECDEMLSKLIDIQEDIEYLKNLECPTEHQTEATTN